MNHSVLYIIKTLSPLTLYSNFDYFIFIFVSHELLTNVPSNHIYPSSTLNKEYFYINILIELLILYILVYFTGFLNKQLIFL